MPNYHWPFGYRNDWRFNPGGSMRKTNGETRRNDQQSERGTSKDSFLSEQAEREANIKARRPKYRSQYVKSELDDTGPVTPRYTSQQLLAMLPDCDRPAKSIDEIVHETLTVIDLLDNA